MDAESIWKAAELAVVQADWITLRRLLAAEASWFRAQRPKSTGCGGLSPDYSSLEAERIITQEHQFTEWPEVIEFLAARNQPESSVGHFETAVDAVTVGDTGTLQRLLESAPHLIRVCSTRKHRATLLHYVGANGVETWRQRTPSNAVAITKLLLQSGADVNSVAELYGGSTTLALAATSIHPYLAGVQNELLDALIHGGATFDHAGASDDSVGTIINACLANGRVPAAIHLAKCGARLDLEGAAGLGRLEVVRGFFKEDGTLKPAATAAQLQSGFQWACQYGQTEVVAYLLDRPVELGRMHRGQTGLHWAAYGGHTEIVRLLLARQAPVNVRDERWHKTPLGWALYGWSQPPTGKSKDPYYEIVQQLVTASSRLERQDRLSELAQSDPKLRSALGF